ncbi:hypothetical protein GE21DRAFT_2401 [Neurospora crassa]|uniref:Nephrocystin 3-like N-terminal domain-containing protein n=1 Tax=Neurospora crassa (strain ATCC 24698 / 74-OR23-1A / CBS 708.71 / DSM 1257 / FGSC 987) TaxID=367110 RepID=Q7SHK7_NEUCR|nr:hypothetical protein NCU02897 [Neurospora crassa OR74A]EAA36343.2 hypothetical protein NCU02897 [Neurospora crassa OR74A]KHE89332.1 hypothetical protein GE21DRAFT_2401 [Neurospora crassa]|eukprot:XP_965579.2 hypothetical protein NCU02897 [Neurospora crassa OR74A]
MRLTRSWSVTSEFAKLFPNSAELQALFSEYLTRVVRLCQQILAVARRPSYLLLASSLFSTFDNEFGPIQEELNMYGALIEKQFTLLTSSQAADRQQAARKETGGMIRRFSKAWRRQYILEQKQQLLHHLSPRQGQQDVIWRRERKRGTASWILTTSEYKSWKAGHQAVLRVTGHLGCGKTVALATIIADAPMEKKKHAGFICKRDDPHTLKGFTILGSIAHQLLQSGTVRQEWEKLIQGNPDTFLGALSVSFIVQLLQSLLPRDETFYVILDGLDECSEEDVEIVLQALQDLRQQHQISVCFSTRLDASGLPTKLTQEYLGTAADLSLNNVLRDTEIEEYIRSEVQRRNARREPQMSDKLVEQVTKALAVGAQGMYLWVSLHIEAIFPSYHEAVLTNESVQDILHHLPKDLPQAFDQALDRIPDRQYGDRIFQLVAVAETCLTGEQLSVALTVQPGDPTWNGARLPHSPKQVVFRCGGGLLEIDEEDDQVRFIHHSVISHMGDRKVGVDGSSLTRSWMTDAESFMGSVCVTYLNFADFDKPHLTEENGARVDVLWRALINDRPPHVSVPWNSSLDGEGGMIVYALNKSHAYLFRHIIRSHIQDDHIFIQTPYFLVLLTIPLEDTSTQFALHMVRKHLAEIKAGSMVDHLWALIEEACLKLSAIAHDEDLLNSLSRQICLAALTALVLLRSTRNSPDPTEDDVFKFLRILSETADDLSFKMVCDYLPMVAGWASDPQSLALLGLQNAVAHNNFSLVKMIMMSIDVDLSIIDRVLEMTKEKSDSMFRSKVTSRVTSLLNHTSHVIKEQPVVGNNDLEIIRTHLMNDDDDQAMESIERWFGRGRPGCSSVADLSLLRKVTEWAIIYRCDEVLDAMPCLPEAVEAWPTVLLDVITTYAQHERLRREDDPERERKIFFTLVKEVQKLESNDMYLTGSDSGPSVDSQWTALHAAALWEPYAVDAVLKLWPGATHQRTTHGLMPLTVSICGRPKQEGYSSIPPLMLSVLALLQAATTNDAKALCEDSLLSPLHCSIACCPPDITEVLVEHGATCNVSLTNAEDSEAYRILMIVALLENRIYYRSSWYPSWKLQAKTLTSLEEYYRYKGPLPMPRVMTRPFYDPEDDPEGYTPKSSFI